MSSLKCFQHKRQDIDDYNPIAPLASIISILLTAEITAQAIMHQHLLISAFVHVALLGSIIKGM